MNPFSPSPPSPETVRKRLPRMLTLVTIASLALLVGCESPGSIAAAPVPADPGTERIVGTPCEGCELVFQGMPQDLGPDARIAPIDEPGEPLRIEGTVYHSNGNPASGIIVYAYHTNAGGVYPEGSTRHGRLRGWAKTDTSGHYSFQTIRPGAYPGREVPEHVHMHVIEPGRCTYYVDSIHFSDDPRLTAEERRRQPGRGGSGLANPRRMSDGSLVVIRDIHLGRNVPGYQACR